MAPYQYIERPAPFSTKKGKTLPIFAVTPAHIATGTIDPVALDWASKAGYKDAHVKDILLKGEPLSADLPPIVLEPTR